MEAGFCGGFMAQWLMVAFVRHPGFESRGCRFHAFLLSLPAGIPIDIRNNIILIACLSDISLWISLHCVQIN